MDECRKELKSGNLDVKANAVSKLNYVRECAVCLMCEFACSWSYTTFGFGVNVNAVDAHDGLQH